MLDIIGVIPPARPTIARHLADTGGPQLEETVSPLPIFLNVYPTDTEVAQAVLEIANDGQIVQAVSVPFVGSFARFDLPTGFTREVDATTTAKMRFMTETDEEVESLARELDIGALSLRVDSNNDAIVAPEGTPLDQADEAAASEGKRFAFWTSSIRSLSVPGDLADWEDALTDFATLSIRLRAPIAADERVAIRLAGASALVRKLSPSELGPTVSAFPAPPDGCVAERKLHLCHQPTAEYQARLASGRVDLLDGDRDERLTLKRAGGVIEIPPELLILNENDFLFACDAGCGDRLEVGRIRSDGSFDPIADAGVEFRPLREQFSVFSVREGGGDGGRPLAEAIPLGASDQIPADTESILVLTHGFVVPTSQAVEEFFPAYLKRLYWAGVPTLEPQRDAQGRRVYIAGFTWPSRFALEPFDKLFFPEAEYAALQSGVPFARLLESWKQGANGPRRINVLAHSLGTIVTNSALTQLPASVVDQFIMHEAALAAEAFDYNYQYTQGDRGDQWPAGSRLGCGEDDECGVLPDRRWDREWQDILNGLTVTPAVPPNFPPVQLSEERWCSELDNTMLAPRPFYFHRWRQRRPDDPRVTEPSGVGTQCGGSAPLPQRGPWLGIFAGNKEKTRIVNTFSELDEIVGSTVWGNSQAFQKPNHDPVLGGQLEQERIVQFWARLNVDNMQEEQYLWTEGDHSDLVRQWQELAHWFPALSRAAGRQPVPGLENRDLTPLLEGLFGRLALTPTHSFATSLPPSRVWGVHRVFAELLE